MRAELLVAASRGGFKGALWRSKEGGPGRDAIGSCTTRQAEFDALLEEIAQRPRPAIDYSQFSAAAFLSAELYHRLCVYQTCYMVLLRTFAVRLSQGLDRRTVIEEGGVVHTGHQSIALSALAQILQEAFQTYPHGD